MNESIYLTTPIYYVNDVPHIGHAYCTIATDVLARYHRLMGKEVYFCTGTDEHGQKIQKTAEENNETPIQLADRVVERFKQLWQDLNISNDFFVRTTDEHHKKSVQDFFKKVYENGDIYLSEYEGLYCRPCESFYTETQLVDGKCPECKRDVETVKEEALFFRMSKYQKPLIEHIDSHPDFIFPKTRRNEVLSFLKEDLRDLCISRTTVDWGIPVPEVEGLNTTQKHYIYVWFDALNNYITAAGYDKDKQKFEQIWQNAVHVLGKDILKFHAIYWPTMLMSAGVKLPEKVVAHGFIIKGGEKMSKSLGNVIDPYEIINDFGSDPLRYYLLKEVSFGQDGIFSYEAMTQRYNSDLANDLGNLLNRTINMVKKYYDSKMPAWNESDLSAEAKELKEMATNLKAKVEDGLSKFSFSLIFEDIWAVIRRANKFIEESAPWTLKKEEKNAELAMVMNVLIESIRIAVMYVAPIMPESAQKMWDQLNVNLDVSKQITQAEGDWGFFTDGHELGEAQPVFPRRQ